jgi:hypothetical protein
MPFVVIVFLLIVLMLTSESIVSSVIHYFDF